MEHDEQVALFNLLELYKPKYPTLNCVFAIPNGGHRHIKVASAMKKEGVLAGAWDIFIAVAVSEYCGMFIEMKFGKNKLTDSQKEFMDNIGKAYKWAVCYSWIEAANEIGKYLSIKELEEIK